MSAKNVGSVAKAIAILRYLAQGNEAGVNAIARDLNIYPSTCFNILRTLVDEDFVTWNPDTKRYSIGIAPAQLFHGGPNLVSWQAWVFTRLEKLAARYAVSLGLWQVSENRLHLLKVADSPLDIRIHLTSGQRLPVYIGAMGRCVAARREMSEMQIRTEIERLKWHDAPSPNSYLKDARAVSVRGWAMDDANYLGGVTTLASPIRAPGNPVAYCLTATSFRGQLSQERLEEAGQNLAKLASSAELRLSRAG